jgi:hypothetical protein
MSQACLIRLVQEHAFSTEIALLRVGRALPKGSKLEKLNAFLVADSGILRVGDRVSGSALPLDHRHPPILPHDSYYSRLLVHYNPSLTASFFNQHALILGSRLLVKSVVKHCIRCQRTKPLLVHQLMVDLPASRVTPSRPFTTRELDYAGPFQVRTTKGRVHRSYKVKVVTK